METCGGGIQLRFFSTVGLATLVYFLSVFTANFNIRVWPIFRPLIMHHQRISMYTYIMCILYISSMYVGVCMHMFEFILMSSLGGILTRHSVLC